MITTVNKITKKPYKSQIVAGLLPTDSNIEFGGIKDTKEVFFVQNGKTHQFSENCPSMLFKYKVLKIKDYILKPREILITDLFKKDFPDKIIADSLNISHSYLDYLKRNLFKNCGVTTKIAFVLLAQKYGVIQL